MNTNQEENKQPLDLGKIVAQAAAAPGKVEMPIEDTEQQPKTTALTEEELAAKLANNAFVPTTDEVEEKHEAITKEDSEGAIQETLDNLDKEWDESYEVRKKFAEAGINPHLTGAVDPEKEAGASEEERERARKMREENERNLTEAEQAKEMEEKHNSGMVVIEKIGDGYLKFNEEEREKLEKADVIRINEVEKVDLTTVKTRKKKKFTTDKIISMVKEAYTFEVVLPSSGMVVSLRGLSTQQLQSLWSVQVDDTIRREATKWRILFDCVTDTSLGKLTFAEFMKNVASTDFETLVFGAMVATYPNDDSIEINCVNQECGQSFDFEYSLRSLIRAEKFTPELTERLLNIIENSHTEEGARLAHEASPVMQTETFKLPQSEYIVTTYTQSAQDLIDITFAQLTEVNDPAYQQSAVLTSAVRQILIPDPEDPEYHIEYTEPEDIIKLIFSLRDKDLLLLSKKIEEVVSDKAIQYGFMNVTCPHCGKYSKTLNLNLTDILFHHSQRVMQTTVE